jgi:hypothetical protein
MMDVNIPVIQSRGIKSPVVAIIVKIVSFMMTPSFPDLPSRLEMAHRPFPSRPRACHRIFCALLFLLH